MTDANISLSFVSEPSRHTSDPVSTSEVSAGINVVGLVVLLCFYLVVLVAGCIFSRRSTGKWCVDNSADHILAGRNIGLGFGILTLSATTVGGGYINGTAEFVALPGYGLIWTQAPILFSIAMALSGFIFAKKMRQENYLTMVDPFEIKYGRFFTFLAYVAVGLGEIFWSGAILSALGATLSVIVGLQQYISIIISAGIAFIYTFAGGLGTVIYTDVIQLAFVVFGLFLCLPFAMTHDAVSSILETATGKNGWIGSLKADFFLGYYIDSALLLLLGGSAWSPLYQRVLSQKTARNAQLICYISCLVSLVLTIPPVLVGAVAKSTDWNATSYAGSLPLSEADYKIILPLVLRHLTPYAVAIIGLSAVASAVMSSCDSAILSASSVFAQNIYKPNRKALLKLFKVKKANGEDNERDVMWVLRISIILTTLCSTAMAIFVNTIYGLFYLAGDLNYVFLFPHLILVLFVKDSNAYGALVSGPLSYFLRLTAGEAFLNFPALIKYPWYDDEYGQLFPFRTCITVLVIVSNLMVSYLSRFLFVNLKVPLKYDFMDCFSLSNNDPADKSQTNIIDTKL